MNPAAKFILRDQLKEKLPILTDDVLYKIVSELDKLGVLKEEWDGSKSMVETENKEVKSMSKLPQSFFMISPMWSGNVFLAEKEGFFVYQDSESRVRLHGRTEKELLKRVLKYKK